MTSSYYDFSFFSKHGQINFRKSLKISPLYGKRFLRYHATVRCVGLSGPPHLVGLTVFEISLLKNCLLEKYAKLRKSRLKLKNPIQNAL